MEILHTYIHNTSGFGEGSGLFGVFTIVLWIVALILLITEGWKVGLTVLAVSLVCAAVSFGLLKLSHNYEVIRHEVTINDIGKFDTDKYKIVNQQGKIFTIEEIK